jgi:hypothetical protein
MVTRTIHTTEISLMDLNLNIRVLSQYAKAMSAFRTGSRLKPLLLSTVLTVQNYGPRLGYDY